MESWSDSGLRLSRRLSLRRILVVKTDSGVPRDRGQLRNNLGGRRITSKRESSGRASAGVLPSIRRTDPLRAAERKRYCEVRNMDLNSPSPCGVENVLFIFTFSTEDILAYLKEYVPAQSILLLKPQHAINLHARNVSSSPDAIVNPQSRTSDAFPGRIACFTKHHVDFSTEGTHRQSSPP